MLVRGIIRDLKARGTTIFLNSHLLGEVEATCDRVSFIKAGTVLRTLSLHNLQQGVLHVELRVDTVTPALQAALDDLVPEWWLVDGGVEQVADARGQVTSGSDRPEAAQLAAVATHSPAAVAHAGAAVLELRVPDEELLPIIAERTLASGAHLYALTPRRISLEQLFLEVVGTEDSGQ
jgi:ABC-2 type transport system ATP-binding protein